MAVPQKPPSILGNSAFTSYATAAERKQAFTEYGNAINNVEPIYRTKGALANQYQNIDTNASIRSPFSRLDYEFFRPNEQVPRLQKQIIASCMTAYDKVGIVRNVIDLMGDFASQGVRLVHPNKSVERFYRSWFKQVGGKERSERFLNHLYRTGNVIMKRNTAKLKDAHVAKFKRTIAKVDLQIDDGVPPGPKEIPWTYTFVNPMMVEVVAPELAAFTGKVFYRIKLPQKVISMIQNPQDQYELGMVNSVPADILDTVNQGGRELKIGDDKLLLSFYKKDDWQIWANPMTYAILDDLITLEKMKLADLAALDGAISHIRIWKLGNLEHKILPTDAAVQKLADLLLNNVGGGSMDLIWGPDLEISETSTDIHKFLGNAKYESVLVSIYAGLGIPPTLTGASPDGGGATNNFVSLRTLIERLRYGRDRLNEFWEKEIKIVQKAMGFKYPAQIMYDHMDLSDESSQLALWTRLVEENVVSDETMREKLGLIEDIEQNRLQREWNDRQNGKRPPKVGPYTDGEPKLSLTKIFAQNGSITPGQAGLDLDQKRPGEFTSLEIQKKAATQKVSPTNKNDGVSGQGRPINSKDKEKRKTKKISPRTNKTHAEDMNEFVGLSMWARAAQHDISEVVTPFFLDKFKKKSVREFSTAEVDEVERFKFVLLYNTKPFSYVDAEYIANLTKDELKVYKTIDDALVVAKNRFVEKSGDEPTLEQMKQLKAFIYSMFFLDGEEENG